MKIIEKIKKRGIGFALRRLDSRYGLGAIESILFRNWLNPFLTVWLCLRSFPLRQAIRLPMFVYGRARLYRLSGKMIVKGKVLTGMITFNKTDFGAPCVASVQSELANSGLIIFYGKCDIRTGCRIRNGEWGTIEIGDDVLISDLCTISCSEQIVIGNTARIAQRTQIMDSNYHYMVNFGKRTVSPITKPIIIGNHCWICNSSTVKGGSVIPDFTTVASNSLVGKDFSNLEPGSVVGGIPAKFIAKNMYRIWNEKFSKKLNAFFLESEDSEFPISEETRIEDIL